MIIWISQPGENSRPNQFIPCSGKKNLDVIRCCIAEQVKDEFTDKLSFVRAFRVSEACYDEVLDVLFEAFEVTGKLYA